MQQALLASARRGRDVPWGVLAAIDLHGCDRDRLADPDAIRAFVPALIDAIGMTAHGPLALEHFGGRPAVTVLLR